jgi:cytochrome b561
VNSRARRWVEQKSAFFTRIFAKPINPVARVRDDGFRDARAKSALIALPILRRNLEPAVKLTDTKNGYGWISIAFHWLVAAIVIAMWTIGSLTQGDGEGQASGFDFLHLHTTIGMTAYVLLWARIIWRFKIGHPGPATGQSATLYPLAIAVHYLLLLALGVALVSGPLTVWLAGDAIEAFSLALPSPFGKFPGAQAIARNVHGITTMLVFGAIALHVLAVIKHAVFNRDGTFDKIMVADGDRT